MTTLHLWKLPEKLSWFAGLDVGGYLGARACAAHSDRLAACVLNPPQYSLSSAFEELVQDLAKDVYQPLQHIAQTQPNFLPDGYAEAIKDDSELIVQTLLLGCNASSAAPNLIAESSALGTGKLPILRIVLDASHPYLLCKRRVIIGPVADLSS